MAERSQKEAYSFFLKDVGAPGDCPPRPKGQDAYDAVESSPSLAGSSSGSLQESLGEAHVVEAGPRKEHLVPLSNPTPCVGQLARAPEGEGRMKIAKGACSGGRRCRS
jgi:hypothetical protein